MSQTKKIAVVTGTGKKNGLGFATSDALAKKGYTVVMVARDTKQLESFITPLKKEGLSVEAFQCDITNDSQVKKLADHVSSTYGRLDVLVNNAGVFLDSMDPAQSSILTADLNTVARSIDINTVGALRMIQAFTPLMKKSGGGNIVNVSSGMGQLSEMNGSFASYRISKTALNAVTKIFSEELNDDKIHVNSVCPGWVRTEMGGDGADRSLEEGIQGIVWAATLPTDGPTGGFFRDGEKLDW